MFSGLALFFAIVALEIILEIDNITALRNAAARLPNSPMCMGQMPHILALGVRVGLACILFFIVSYFRHLRIATGNGSFEQIGGLVLILMGVGLIINYKHSRRDKHSASLRERISAKSTTLGGFLFADALLSLDTVLAAVAMTNNFFMAVTAMICASVCIMCNHKRLHAWLQANPRAALIAFVIIGLLGVNMIVGSFGVHIHKSYFLIVVVLGVFLDKIDKDNKVRAAALFAKTKARQTVRKVSPMQRMIENKANYGQASVAQPVAMPSATMPSVIPAFEVIPVSAAYTYGTTHSAAVDSSFKSDFSTQSSRPGKINCTACGAEQDAGTFTCKNCSAYLFFS